MLSEDLKKEIVFGEVSRTPLKKGERKSFALPTTPGFVGRAGEIRKLNEEFAARHIFIIEGMAGTGKTYLGAYFAQQMKDRCRIFFGECQEEMGLSTLLKETNDFLIAQGEMGFDFILQDTGLNGTQKIRSLINILERGRYILILDDFHYLKEEEVEEIVTSFDRFFEETRLILLTRQTPHFVGRLKPNNIAEIILSGFNDDEATAYLSSLLNLKDEGVLREVSRKTGGLPLALNLFGSLSRYYKIEELLKSLPDYAKEVINQNLIDRVFATLNDDEVRMLTRFSVFRKPVSPRVLSYLYPAAGWEKIFVGLIDKLQLSRTEDDRVLMQPLIRQFSYERCKEKRKCHIIAARYYLSLGENLENKIEACHHYLEAEEYERAGEIAAGIGNELIRKGDVDLAHKIISRLIEATPQPNPELHLLLGKILQIWGRFDEAISVYDRAYNHFTDPEKKALAQNQIGGVYLYKGDYREAQNFFEESLGLRREINDKAGVAEGLHQIGVLCLARGDYQAAREYLEESLRTTRPLEDKGAIAQTLNEMARVHFYEKECNEALSKLNEALLLCRESEDRLTEATILHNMGSAYLETGNYEKASGLFEESLKIREQIGDRFGLARGLHQLGSLYFEKKGYKKAREYFERSKAIFEELGSDDAKHPQHYLDVIRRQTTVDSKQ